ncbi:alginate lyase family protein [Pelagibacterales bacterium SAG-MED20]|nr:alginate lyase family protein [Pelagibacterales bacterium SAG-MED20]
MKRILIVFLFLFLIPNLTFADFKKIKKKAVVNNPEIIFPIPKNLKKCITNSYVNKGNNPVLPVIKVDAPSGYGLDNRFNFALNKFENFKRPCGGGNVEACENVKRVILDWAKADAAQRTGPSDHEAKHWNDTLTVNLYIASPMMAGYSFAKQRISVPEEEDKIIKDWFKKIVKKNQHLMYELKRYKQGTQAIGVPRSAHNHALSSAISHMQLGILLNDNKLFKKVFRNYENAIRYQRKDGSMPIETRRGGRAIFYQGRAMTALTTIAIIAENQGYNIWDYEYKGKNLHNLVKFFIDFTENNEIVFKYAKEMKAPGPAKDYKRQDVNGSSSSQWGWLYAYASRFPNHENIQRLKLWSVNYKDLNNYQRKIISNFDNILKRNAGTSSWTVVEPRCHFTK